MFRTEYETCFYLMHKGDLFVKTIPVLFAATTLAISVGVLAQPLKNDASPFDLNVPDLRSGFQFNVEGSFLKPSNSDLDYAILSDDDFPRSQLLSVRPDTDFSWGVGVGYVFPNSGNDVRLNWREFERSDTEAVTADDSRSSFSSTGTARFDLNEIDLNVGQYINVGNRLQLRPFAGLRHARVESNLNTRYTSGDRLQDSSVVGGDRLLPEVVVRESINDRLYSRFSGLGPQLGVDANYNLGEGVHAVGHLATALLVGKVHVDSSEVVDFNYSEGLSFAYNADDQTRVVPAFDAKLGLNYSYTFDCESVFTIEGGYKATQYVDAIDRLRLLDSSYILSGDVFSSVSVAEDYLEPISFSNSSKTSGVGFSGPYIQLSLKI